MEHVQAKSEFDRRSVLIFGAAGAAALFGGASSASANEAKVEELAPGVTLKTLKEVAPVGPVPRISKARIKVRPSDIENGRYLRNTGSTALCGNRREGTFHVAAR